MIINFNKVWMQILGMGAMSGDNQENVNGVRG